MKRVKTAYRQYLQRIERLDEINLGRKKTEKKKSRPVTRVDNQLFEKLLQEQLKLNQWMVILFVIMLCIIFCGGLFLAFYFINSPGKLGGFSGITLLSLLVIVERLQRLWKEKSLMDITLLMVRELPAEEMVKVVETIYWSVLNIKK